MKLKMVLMSPEAGGGAYHFGAAFNAGGFSHPNKGGFGVFFSYEYSTKTPGGVLFPFGG